VKHTGRNAFTIVILSLLLFSSPAVIAQQTDDSIEDITDEVSVTRGLEPSSEIIVTPKTREQLTESLEEDLLEDYPEDEQYGDERELVAFGLMEPGIDLGDLSLELYSEQIAGYYDPETGEMVVIQDAVDGTAFSPSQQVTYAHEIVHALQDQNFDLDGGVLDREPLTDDQSLAVTALIEGDASFSEVQYLLERPELLDSFLIEIDEQEFESDVLDAAPPILRETLLFPYDNGYTFVEAIYDEGGWDAVNVAFADPPTSTEQILHPEKFLAGEEPVKVNVPDFTADLGSDWQVFDTNTFGEYQIRVIMEQTSMPAQQAEAIGVGWDGDTYIVGGTETLDAVHWQSVWESTDDASEFAQGLALYESERWGVAPTYLSDSVIRFESDSVIAHIELTGDTVTYLQAPDEQALKTIMDAEGASESGTSEATPVGSPEATPVS
jgi:hypothetical protein